MIRDISVEYYKIQENCDFDIKHICKLLEYPFEENATFIIGELKIDIKAALNHQNGYNIKVSIYCGDQYILEKK
jgi:hypothetical protein